MKKMFMSIALGLLLCLTLTGASCSNGVKDPIADNIIVDGKLDPVSQAVIGLAVSAALDARPDAVIPANVVSGALLAVIDSNNASFTVATLPLIQSALEHETAKLNLNTTTLQSFNMLVVLVKAEIDKRINATGIQNSNQVILIKDVVQIVHDVSETRMPK